jgi:hypothetical protein
VKVPVKSNQEARFPKLPSTTLSRIRSSNLTHQVLQLRLRCRLLTAPLTTIPVPLRQKGKATLPQSLNQRRTIGPKSRILRRDAVFRTVSRRESSVSSYSNFLTICKLTNISVQETKQKKPRSAKNEKLAIKRMPDIHIILLIRVKWEATTSSQDCPGDHFP